MAPLAEVGDFARSVQGRDHPQSRLQYGVDLVVGLVDSCDHAGVTIARQGRLLTSAASDDVVRRGDDLQVELDEGPCLEAIRSEQTVLSQDLGQDSRWPRWSAQVRTLGVHAMLSVLLFTDSDTYGALNLYADRTGVWTDEDVVLAYALAGHLAVAIADAAEITDRGRAMLSRTVIGQAEGILMERLALDADQAFAYLRRVSQQQNRKIVDLATDLVRTRRLPSESDEHHPPATMSH